MHSSVGLSPLSTAESDLLSCGFTLWDLEVKQPWFSFGSFPSSVPFNRAAEAACWNNPCHTNLQQQEPVSTEAPFQPQLPQGWVEVQRCAASGSLVFVLHFLPNLPLGR